MLPADISMPLAAVVSWIIAPGSRRLSYSSPLAAVIFVWIIFVPLAWWKTGPQGPPPYLPGVV